MLSVEKYFKILEVSFPKVLTYPQMFITIMSIDVNPVCFQGMLVSMTHASKSLDNLSAPQRVTLLIALSK